jgi:hypothetical protein
MYLERFLFLTCHNVQVLTRYLLQKLFGPGVVGLTNNENILYLDLPSNMVSLSLSLSLSLSDKCTHLSIFMNALERSACEEMHA